MPVILVINKVDRPDARIAEVVDETYELFLDLDADEHQIEFPIVYASAQGRSRVAEAPGGRRDAGGGEPAAAVRDHPRRRSRRRPIDDGAPLQAHVTNLDASPYLGRLALCRVHNGTIRKGQQAAWCRADGTVERVKITELLMTRALDRFPAESAGPGDIIAIAGIPEITIGETLADPDDPRPLPVITIDEPSISMTIGINTSPLAGESGKKLTARQVINRLEAELVGNVSIRVLPTERPDTWEVQGRGELQLAILVEIMRREGFEITVGKPQVVTRTIDGKLHEPMERMTIDIPSEYQGVVIQLLALRKGRLEQMVDHGTGWIRMEYLVPARGLIGFRTEFLTETRGTGLLHHIHEGYEPWAGDIRTRPSGSLVADRRGATTGFALANLQERGTMFVGPGTEVYEGMIVGENSRQDDMDVNPTKEKKLTNMRQSSGDVLVPLIPHRVLSLEQALEFCRDDECVEVTPATVRIRKVDAAAPQDREKLRGRANACRADRARTAPASAADGLLQLGLGHLRAALDVLALGLGVELVAGAAAGAASASAGRRAARTRCPRSRSGWPAWPRRRGPAPCSRCAPRSAWPPSCCGPRSSRPSSMCSYWRSRFALQACCGIPIEVPARTARQTRLAWLSADRTRSSSACAASAPRSSPRCRRWPSQTDSVNLGQGFPDTDGPPELLDARGRGHPQPATTSTRPARHPRAARGDRGAPAAPLRARLRPRHRGPGHRRAPPRRSRPRSSRCAEPGDEVVVFEPYYDSYAACIALAGAHRRAGHPAPRRRRLDASTPTRCERAVTAAHQGAAAQHAAQPDRQGLHPRRARR